jgi:hypothetical protein
MDTTDTVTFAAGYIIPFDTDKFSNSGMLFGVLIRAET